MESQWSSQFWRATFIIFKSPRGLNFRFSLGHALTVGKPLANGHFPNEKLNQEMHVFELRRPALLAGGGLVEIARDAQGFNHLNPMAVDPFDAASLDEFRANGPSRTLA